MNRDDAIDIVQHALDNVHDMDTPWSVYAAAAVDALGWRSLADDPPDEDGELVIATDGKARWLAKWFSDYPDINFGNHKATHWHPVLDLPSTKVEKISTATENETP